MRLSPKSGSTLSTEDRGLQQPEASRPSTQMPINKVSASVRKPVRSGGQGGLQAEPQ